MRCLGLAQELRRRGAKVRFTCRPQAGDLIDLLGREGFVVHRLPEGGGADAGDDPAPTRHHRWLGGHWRRDAENVVAAAGGPVDWIVVDHYALDARWELHVTQVARRVMAIDDLADRRHDCALLLDAGLHADARALYRPLIGRACQPLFGSQFALLRPEFAQAREALAERDGRIRRILISFGGADAHDLTSRAVQALLDMGHDAPAADVVLGRSHPQAAQIEASCQGTANITVHRQVSDMAALMARADFALGAGGTTVWERCCLGLPGVVVCVADNQALWVQALADRGAAVGLEAAEASPATFQRVLRRYLADPAATAEMSGRAAALNDGLGARRVSDALMAATGAA